VRVRREVDLEPLQIQPDRLRVADQLRWSQMLLILEQPVVQLKR
jgi:hypothetical protein